MISLEEVKPFAEGGNRVCYIHPNNKSMLRLANQSIKMRSNDLERSLDQREVLTITIERRVLTIKELLKKPSKIWRHLANGMNL